MLCRSSIVILVVLTGALLAWPHSRFSRVSGSAQPYCARWAPEKMWMSKESLALPTDYGGVHHYSIPGEFNFNTSGAGVLHVYLKALRWPVTIYNFL